MTQTINNFPAREAQFQQLKVEIHEKLISGMNFAVSRAIDDSQLREELGQAVEHLSNRHSNLLSQADRNRLIEELMDETLGLGPLERLMHDPTVSDILINGPECVYVERQGVLQRTNVRFRDSDHLLGIIQRIVGRVGRRIDESSPMVDARLADGSRLNAVIHPLALDGALVSIRRSPGKGLDLRSLIANRSATPAMLDFLATCVKARLNILVSGGTGSGKTTLLGLLSGFISGSERIATIEDAAELRLQQPHVARMETRSANLDGKGEVTSRDLLRNALRMRPDRIIVGECRGTEALDMMQAMSTGHDGSMSTIHANDAREALSRLEMLVGMAAPELPMWFIHRQITSAIDIVVQVSRLSGGARKIVQISELTGMQGDNFSMHDLFQFQQTGIDDNGAAVGEFHSMGIVPHCLDRFEKIGVKYSPSSFREGVNDRQILDNLRRQR